MSLPFRKGMDAIKSAANNGKNKTFKIEKAGDKAIIRFAQEIDEIIVYDEHGLGEGKEKRYYTCLGENCPLCEAGIKLRTRAIPMIITPQGKLDFFKISGNTLKLITGFYEKYKTIQNRKYEFTKTSDNFNPYQIIPEDPEPLTEAEKAIIQKPLNIEDYVRMYTRQELIVKLNAHVSGSDTASNTDEEDSTAQF